MPTRLGEWGRKYHANHIVIATSKKPRHSKRGRKRIWRHFWRCVFAVTNCHNSAAILSAGYIAVELCGCLTCARCEDRSFCSPRSSLRNFWPSDYWSTCWGNGKSGPTLHTNKCHKNWVQLEDGTVEIYFEDGTTFAAEKWFGQQDALIPKD